MSGPAVHLVHLYQREMNIYGDTGNRLVLQHRLERSGVPVQVSICGVGDPLPRDAHLLLGGGGQDVGQAAVGADLQRKRPDLAAMKADGIPMLMICGMYQLFGEYFHPFGAERIDGAGLLPVGTDGQAERLIGNVTVDSQFGELVGYENHSGLTRLQEGAQPLGRVVRGAGNNGEDGSEGAVDGSIIGTYLHGPVLAKSPGLADHLLLRALAAAGLDAVLGPFPDLDDRARAAAEAAKARPR
jgi:CobQ-like glutamine amidotransferase family enzyme